MKQQISFLFFITFISISCNNIGSSTKEIEENSIQNSSELYEKKVTPSYELYKLNNPDTILVLFPGGSNTAKQIQAEFKIKDKALKNGISLLLMNFNRHLWLEPNESKKLAVEIESIFVKNKINPSHLFIGGMSLGGNVALSLSEHLIESNQSISPKGIFIVDSPIDLYALYESSIVDLNNPNLNSARLSEPKGIKRHLENNFGEGKDLITNIQKVSPFTYKTKKFNFETLKESKLRFYIEPDKQWYKENRQTDFEYTNAYTIQQCHQYLEKELHWKNIELIETSGKGFRSNGERNPHSWSIVDVDDLITWIKGK